MTFSVQELGLILYVVNQTKEGQARKFAVVELAAVLEIVKKIRTHADAEGKIAAGEYEVDFSTDEKARILKLVDEMEWTPGDAETVLSLQEKLK